jgi:hypothetical protein
MNLKRPRDRRYYTDATSRKFVAMLFYITTMAECAGTLL